MIGSLPLDPRVLWVQGNQTTSTGFPRFSVPAYELGEGGGQHGAGVFASHSCENAIVGDTGRGRLGYRGSILGCLIKEESLLEHL
jgi:hypothetical protein